MVELSPWVNPSCQSCPLHKAATNVCIDGSGPLDSPVLVLGEAPGASEDESGKPFQGASGQVLNDLLALAGLERAQVRISNSVRCRPPGNNTPAKKFLKACRKYLEREIAHMPNLKLIVPLGNVALQQIDPKSTGGITKHAGTLKTVTVAGKTVNVYPSLHPASCLYQPANRAKLETAFIGLGNLIKTPDTDIDNQWSIQSVLTPESFADYLSFAREHQTDTPAWDLETTGLDPYAEDASIVTVSIAWPSEKQCFVLGFDHKSSVLDKALLQDFAYTIPPLSVAHNAQFDVSYLQVQLADCGIELTGTVHDTMVLAHIENENQSLKLKDLAVAKLGVAPWADVDFTKDIRQTSWQKLSLYNGKDAIYTSELYTRYNHETNLPLFTKIATPALTALTHLRMTGIPLNLDTVAIAEKEQYEVIEEAETNLGGIAKRYAPYTLKKHKDRNWNPVSKFFAEFADEALGGQLWGLTDAGKPSWSRHILSDMRLEGGLPAEIADNLLAWRQAQKALGFTKSWKKLECGGILRPSYRLTGTQTGRLSCSTPNLQQTPRGSSLRNCFGLASNSNTVFVEIDYGQLEIVTAAMLFDEPTMQDAIRANNDLHRLTAAKALNKPESEITKAERTVGKTIGFGFLYGMGAKKYVEQTRTSYGLNLTLDEAEHFRQMFFDLYPGLLSGHEKYMNMAKYHGYIWTPFGRRRHLPGIYSEAPEIASEAVRQAINSPIQSTASDLVLIALGRLHTLCRGSTAKIVGTIHDSVLLIVEKEESKAILESVTDIMVNPDLTPWEWELTVPLTVEVATGSCWGDEDAKTYKVSSKEQHAD